MGVAHPSLGKATEHHSVPEDATLLFIDRRRPQEGGGQQAEGAASREGWGARWDATGSAALRPLTEGLHSHAIHQPPGASLGVVPVPPLAHARHDPPLRVNRVIDLTRYHP